jgi:5-formyltetrahydrofolate cyclo-ligase
VKQNVLAPGVALTQIGSRLGAGDGFFNRFLFNRAPQAVIGACFNVQIVVTD